MFCFDSPMTSAIVKGPHHDTQQLLLCEWDILWYTWKKYQRREYLHIIDDQGIQIHEKKYF